jgi:hypothetical protein
MSHVLSLSINASTDCLDNIGKGNLTNEFFTSFWEFEGRNN